MPKVTVLMPVYNAEEFLAEAIESILGQTLKEFEFLIIDDGSTDNSEAIVRSFHDSRIRFIQNERNMGIAATLNKGIALASAEFIARMDADDISYPDRLFKQHNYLQKHQECCLVGAQTTTISKEGKLLWKDNLIPAHTYYNLTFFCAIYHPTVMYRKKTVSEAGMYNLPYAEDYELWCRLSRSHRVHVLPEVLLDYRLTGKSTSNEIKKNEYNQTELQQILANLRYFAGECYTIPESYLECFRFNYKPLLAERNISNIINCIQELNKITALILAKENVNRNPQAILDAADLKRKQIVGYFAKKLPRHKAAVLVTRLQLMRLVKKLRYN